MVKMLSTLMLVVYSIAIEMSGEIHNRVEELPKNFPVKNTENEADTNIECTDESKKRLQSLSCEICRVQVTSSKIFQRHLDGRKHKMRAERQGKVFKCELCDLIANSEIQLEIHFRSARHKTKLQKKEHPHFTLFTTYTSKNSLLTFFCFVCILLNLFLLLK